MKNKFQLFSSIFQLTIGICAVASFIFLNSSEENMTKWIPTLILSIAFVILGTIGIIDFCKQK